MQQAVFKGSESETMALLEATEHSCVDPDRCQKDSTGHVVKVCSAHRALLDQRFLDGVLCVRRGFRVFWEQEFQVKV